MPLEQQIVHWATVRPPWQQHILRRVARGEVLTDKDYNRVVEALLASDQFGDGQLAIEDLPATTERDDPVRLKSVAEPRHVNALSSAEPLAVAPEGITIVYGDNGSGKSGYARLLKRIARARHQEEILSDVFRDTNRAEPRARIEVLIGNQEEVLNGPVSRVQEIKRMLFYDRECGDAYISAESDFPYRPSALLVMDGLIEACTAVQRLIDIRLAENSAVRKVIPKVEDIVKDTAAGGFLSELSGRSSIRRLDALIQGVDLATESAEILREREARLTVGDTKQERRRLNTDADKLESLAAHLEKIEMCLGTDAVSELKAQRDRVRTLDEATTVLARGFEAEPLDGVGTSSWKELWEAAKRFSETDAYPGVSFPVVDADCRCVLCQQALDDEGRRRLERFDKFVRTDTQLQLATAREQLDLSSGKISKLSVRPEAVKSNLLELEESRSVLVSEARLMLVQADEVQTALVGSISDFGDPSGVAFECESLISRFREAAAQARLEADELTNPQAVLKRLEVARKKRMEAELAGAMRELRDDIVQEIQRLKQRAKLEGIKHSAATGVITRKLSDLSALEVTEVIRDRFTREADRLQLEKVTLAKTRAERTALLHQPKLIGARQRVRLPRVFSEGEKTALGLAAFFTEAHLDPSKSALILDDPVSSLDHVRRGLVATRLVELALERQIIVFTHDVSLVADLKREASGKGVRVTDRSVQKSRKGERKPGTCSTKHPWKAKDVTERLGELRESLAKIKRDASGWEEDHYEAEVGIWSGNLSETWERIFSQELVGPVLAEGGIEVRPKMVKVLALFSNQDNEEFQASYRRVSQWAKRHDKGVKVNFVAPDVSTLDDELSLVDCWFKRVKGYKNQ